MFDGGNRGGVMDEIEWIERNAGCVHLDELTFSSIFLLVLKEKSITFCTSYMHCTIRIRRTKCTGKGSFQPSEGLLNTEQAHQACVSHDVVLHLQGFRW